MIPHRKLRCLTEPVSHTSSEHTLSTQRQQLATSLAKPNTGTILSKGDYCLLNVMTEQILSCSKYVAIVSLLTSVLFRPKPQYLSIIMTKFLQVQGLFLCICKQGQFCLVMVAKVIFISLFFCPAASSFSLFV